jgi:hypothetical protein
VVKIQGFFPWILTTTLDRVSCVRAAELQSGSAIVRIPLHDLGGASRRRFFRQGGIGHKSVGTPVKLPVKTRA